MAAIENIRSLTGAQSHPDSDSNDSRRPLTTKLHLYEALYILNRGFEAVMLALKRLEELGVFQQEGLDAYKVLVEKTRAETNEELTTTLQAYEEDDSAYWDRRHHERQKLLQGPRRRLLRGPRSQKGNQRADQGTSAGIGTPKPT
ncbi:MAG TPA: hypothetical protein VGJ30_02280 [Candidatus Angelobacter sp.]|jgi:hypothetical protein